MKRASFLLMAAALLGVMACTAGPASPSGSVSLGGGSRLAPGPGISIDDAIASGSDEPLLVNGSLVIADGVTRLCSALLESYPPQCGDASLVVVGLEPGAFGLTEANGVAWAEDIQLLGVVSGDVLTIPTGTP